MLMTLQEHVKNCNSSEIIRRMILQESIDMSLVREYIDTLFAISELHTSTCIPGNEVIIVDIRFPEKIEKASLFYVLNAADQKVRIIRLADLKLKEIAQLFISDYVLNTYGIEAIISEALYSFCKKKEKRIRDRTNLVNEMEREDKKNRAFENKVLRIRHVVESGRRMDRHNMIEELHMNFGHSYSWAEIMDRESMITDRICRSLMPYNPPSLSKLKDYSQKEIKSRTPFCISEKISKDSSIIIEPYRISDLVPPLIYVQSHDSKETLWDFSIVELLRMPIIVKEKKLQYRRDLIYGYLLLYLAYPQRMHRETRRDAIALFANVISRRANM